jgi:colanic acid/amylovoran biosynthesis glycosyltransferase
MTAEMNVQPRHPARPRIVVLTRTFPKLSETFVTDHVHALVAAGFEVIVVARRVDRALQARLFDVAVDAMQLPSWRELGLKGAIAAARGCTAWIRAHRTFRAHRTAWKHALYGQRLRAVLTRLRPDLVHAHFGPNGIDAAIALEGSATPLICNFHGFDATAYALRHGWDLYRATLGRATLVVHSNFMERLLTGNGLSRPERIRLGVDRTVFRPRPRAEHWAAPVRLITVGRLEHQKGQDLAVRALARLREQAPQYDFRLRLVGAGSQAEPLRRLAGTLGLGAVVEGPAPASYAEVATALDHADLAIIPSRVGSDGSQESFCRVAIEAMASGLPLVATPTGGLPDTVGSGGTIAAHTSVEGLADAVLATLERRGPAQWLEIATAEASGYDISAMSGGYVALTERLLRERVAAT